MDKNELRHIVDSAVERANLTRLGAYKQAYDEAIKDDDAWDTAERKAAFDSILPFIKEAIYLALDKYDDVSSR